MTIVFENHTHAFKRSKRIKDGQPHENGTYYLGEGAWGVVKPSGVCKPDHAEITEKVTLDQNVWVLRIDESNTIKAQAYNNEGYVFDQIDITY